MKIANISPLPPQQTGVADYSHDLAIALSQYADLTCVSDVSEVPNTIEAQGIKFANYEWFEQHHSEFDHIIFHIGNSPFHAKIIGLLEKRPGSVILHDFYLGHLLKWMEATGDKNRWSRSLLEAHGYRAIKDSIIDPLNAVMTYPGNASILKNAQQILVHSAFTLDLCNQWLPREIAKKAQIIPFLKSAPPLLTKKFPSKSQLNIDTNKILVCSFGFIAPTKRTEEIVKAIGQLDNEIKSQIFFVFVGGCENKAVLHDLADLIAKHQLSTQVKITGFVSKEIYSAYLAAADIAVQLRSNSRGESSAAVLDCLSYAIPTIVNKNGSLAEIPEEAVLFIEDNCTSTEIAQAMAVLAKSKSMRSRLLEYNKTNFQQQHAPDICAKAILDAISNSSELVDDIGVMTTSSTETPLTSKSTKRLFLDITATAHSSLQTGIERCVSAYLLNFIALQPKGILVEPVYLSQNENGSTEYRRATNYTLSAIGGAFQEMVDDKMEPNTGDIVILLDLAHDQVKRASEANFFKNLQNAGVSMNALVYDLLPINLPQAFPPETGVAHSHWISIISTFDKIICISNAVAADVRDWFYHNKANEAPPIISSVHLGADFRKTLSLGSPKNHLEILLKTIISPTFLMVGTIEPRKGYSETLNEFEILWRNGVDVNLLIVGREGWRGLPDSHRRDIPDTIRKIRNHTELGTRLFWIDDCSDEFLDTLYLHCDALIAASFGEGFGLPIIEAARHKIPIIARDITIFREVAEDAAYYFNSGHNFPLSEAIMSWLDLWKKGKQPMSGKINASTWKESTVSLALELNINLQ